MLLSWRTNGRARISAAVPCPDDAARRLVWSLTAWALRSGQRTPLRPGGNYLVTEWNRRSLSPGSFLLARPDRRSARGHGNVLLPEHPAALDRDVLPGSFSVPSRSSRGHGHSVDDKHAAPATARQGTGSPAARSPQLPRFRFGRLRARWRSSRHGTSTTPHWAPSSCPCTPFPVRTLPGALLCFSLAGSGWPPRKGVDPIPPRWRQPDQPREVQGSDRLVLGTTSVQSGSVQNRIDRSAARRILQSDTAQISVKDGEHVGLIVLPHSDRLNSTKHFSKRAKCLPQSHHDYATTWEYGTNHSKSSLVICNFLRKDPALLESFRILYFTHTKTGH